MIHRSTIHDYLHNDLSHDAYIKVATDLARNSGHYEVYRNYIKELVTVFPNIDESEFVIRYTDFATRLESYNCIDEFIDGNHQLRKATNTPNYPSIFYKGIDIDVFDVHQLELHSIYSFSLLDDVEQRIRRVDLITNPLYMAVNGKKVC